MDDNTQPEIDIIWNEAKSSIQQGNFDTLSKVVRVIRVLAIIKKPKYKKEIKYVC